MPGAGFLMRTVRGVGDGWVGWFGMDVRENG